jgi:hypothetical protein
VTISGQTTSEPQIATQAAFSTTQRGHLNPRWLMRQSTSFLAVLTFALIVLQFVLTLARPDFEDPDIWWHLRDAQFLLQNHSFLRHDLYSFTAAGHAWVNTEWLAEIPFYFAYRAFGVAGLKAMTFILPSVMMLLLLYLG